MKIFEQDGKIHLQMMLLGVKMLFDFTIEKELFNEMRDHIIEHLLAFKLED